MSRRRYDEHGNTYDGQTIPPTWNTNGGTMKVRIMPRAERDAASADAAERYIEWLWTRPLDEVTFFQFLAFVWLLVRANERMRQATECPCAMCRYLRQSTTEIQ